MDIVNLSQSSDACIVIDITIGFDTTAQQLTQLKGWTTSYLLENALEFYDTADFYVLGSDMERNTMKISIWLTHLCSWDETDTWLCARTNYLVAFGAYMREIGVKFEMPVVMPSATIQSTASL